MTGPGPHSRLWRLSIPIILSNLTVPLLGAVDTAVVGHLPAAYYMGGVALGAQTFNFVFWGFGFLRMGTSGFTAQAVGAGDESEIRLILTRALIVAAGLGIAIVLLRHQVLWAALQFLGGSAEVQQAASDYVLIRIWAAPAALGNYVVLGWLLGRQRTGVALALQVLINGINAALAVLFVQGFGWNAAGAAGATAIADVVGLVAGLAVGWRFLRPSEGRYRLALIFDGPAMRRLIAVNRDIFLRTLCLVFAFAFFARQGAEMGDTVLAANAVLLYFQTLMAFGLDGLAHATEALVGTSIGARDRTGFWISVRVSLLWSFVMASFFSLAYFLAGDLLIAALSGIPDVRSTAALYLPWAAISPVISVWSYLLDGIFIGATRTRELRNSMVLAVMAFLAALFLLRGPFGNHGLWMALLVLMAARGIFLAAFLPRLSRGLA